MEKKRAKGRKSMDSENTDSDHYLINMKDILHKAEIRRWGNPQEKVNLQHLSPNRACKKQKYVEEVPIYPFNDLLAQIKHDGEKDQGIWEICRV